MAKWTGILSTTEPYNHIGLMKVRQNNTNSETFEVQIVENNKSIDLTGLQVFFCTSFNLKDGTNKIVQEKATIKDAKNGKVTATLTDHSMYQVGKQIGYFEIWDGQTKLNTTQNFEYTIETSVYKKTMDAESYIQRFEDVLDTLSDDAAFGLATNVNALFNQKADRTELSNSLNSKRDKAVKISRSDMDTSSDSVRLGLQNLSQEVHDALSGNAGVNPTIPDLSIVTEKLADNVVTKEKLGYLSPNNRTGNLLDLNAIIKGGFHKGDGTFETNGSFGEAKIPVTPGQTYMTDSNVYHYSFYKKDGTYIFGETTNVAYISMVAPDNSAYLCLPVPHWGTEKEKGENMVVIEGTNIIEKYAQPKMDQMTSLATSQIPNITTSSACLTGNNVTFSITIESDGYYLNIPDKSYVSYKNMFRSVPKQKVKLKGMGISLGTWIYFNPLTSEIFSETTEQINKDYCVHLGVMFDSINPNAWLLNIEGELMFDGVHVSKDRVLTGKKMGILGDSITEGVGTDKQYHAWFPQTLGCSVVNYGIGGTSITKKNGDFPAWDLEPSFVERYNEMANDLDVACVFGGVNDWVTSRTIGTPNDTENTTLYGALNILFKGLRDKYIGKPIIMFTPMQTDWTKRTANDGTVDGRNKDGHYLIEYVEVIKEVAKKYAIPTCDMYSEMFYPFNETFASQYMPDYLHPNKNGHKKMATKMSSFISSKM